MITPPVDDAYVFGQIAAANALSDVYAMGGRPIACLNLLGFPSKRLGGQVLRQILEGAVSKISEAGAVLAGGHTMEEEEPKFGLSVIGFVHPDRFWANRGHWPGSYGASRASTPPSFRGPPVLYSTDSLKGSS